MTETMELQAEIIRLKTEFEDRCLVLDELKKFVMDITLFLQKHANYNPEKIEPMFQRAYRLYVKHDVERT